MNKVLLFDFDGTVFDTSSLKRKISQEIKQYSQNTESLWEIEYQLRNERYHLVETMKKFCEQQGIEHAQHFIQEIFLKQNFEDFVYPDFLQILPKIQKNAILCIFSQGDESYQQVKIHQSGIGKLVQFTYIFHRKLPHLPQIVDFFDGKEIWLIDNHFSMLNQAKRLCPNVKTFWINRFMDIPDEPLQIDAQAHSLLALPQFL